MPILRLLFLLSLRLTVIPIFILAYLPFSAGMTLYTFLSSPIEFVIYSGHSLHLFAHMSKSDIKCLIWKTVFFMYIAASHRWADIQALSIDLVVSELLLMIPRQPFARIRPFWEKISCHHILGLLLSFLLSLPS